MLGYTLFGTSEFLFSYSLGLAVPTLDVLLCLLWSNLLDSTPVEMEIKDTSNTDYTYTYFPIQSHLKNDRYWNWLNLMASLKKIKIRFGS